MRFAQSLFDGNLVLLRDAGAVLEEPVKDILDDAAVFFLHRKTSEEDQRFVQTDLDLPEAVLQAAG